MELNPATRVSKINRQLRTSCVYTPPAPVFAEVLHFPAMRLRMQPQIFDELLVRHYSDQVFDVIIGRLGLAASSITVRPEGHLPCGAA